MKLKFFALLVVGLILTGCSTKYVEMPDLNLTQKNYPSPEEISNLSFALAEPYIKVNTALTTTTDSGLIERVKNDTKRISCYLNDEINKILLSKGFTITDRFQSPNHLTFTQKRNTSALFYPEIVIEVTEKSQLELTKFLFFQSQSVKGRLQIDAIVNIVMMEPLSGEKIWVKSLPIEEINDNVIYKPNRYGGPSLNGFAVPLNLEEIADKVDNMFEEISESVIYATEKYVEKNEFEFLNDDIIKLKGIKRY